MFFISAETELFLIIVHDRHGTETHLGFIQDTKSNDLFTFVLHQASMVNFPYDPVLHDLSLSPSKMSAVETVDFWLTMYETRDVTLWRQDFRDVDLDTPSLMLTFAGIFGHLMLLEWDYNTTLSIANPLLGLQDHKHIFILKYCC